MKYRKDIQILRGIAVLLVVLFHLDLAGFKSGFLGVDVFFVISGYLMAVMYDPRKKSEFFVKRAKRLLPAYFAVVFITVITAMVIVTPNDYHQVSNQARFAAVFSSNIGFWMENSYFDKAAFKPLLHLWSLGVEIQFYLLIPIIYWAYQKTRTAVPIIICLSLFLCAVVVGISPKTSFFWLPFRLWEFLTGFMVAGYVHKKQFAPSHLQKWIGAASLVLISCIPLVNIDGNQLGFIHGHPGMIAVFITLATAVTLAFGIPAPIENNLISGILEKLGNGSYSIYLAHFPVIVFFLYTPFAGTVLKADKPGQYAWLILLIICASILLFKFIERPFRSGRHTLRWIMISPLVVFAVCSLGDRVQNILTPQKEMQVYQAWFDRSEYRCGKLSRILHPAAISCEITPPVKNPAHRVFLVGNSHADSIKSTFAAAARNADISVYFMVENNPLMNGGTMPWRLIQEALARDADSIVLHYSPDVIDYAVINEVASLAREYHLQLAFIMPVPVWDAHIPETLIKNIMAGEEIPSQDINDYLEANRSLIDCLDRIDYEKFRVYPVADVFCTPDCRVISEDGKPLYFDKGHLTLTGSELLEKVFSRLMADLD